MASEHETYPEHDKLAKVSDRSQAIGEFLEWLRSERSIALAERHHHTEACRCDDPWHDAERFTGPKACPGCLQSQDSMRHRTNRPHVCGFGEGMLLPTYARVTDLLAEYFEIDQDAIEAEKRAILEALRGAA